MWGPELNVHCQTHPVVTPKKLLIKIPKFSELTNTNLIDEIDAAGQGHPGLGARLEYRTARLGPSMYMPSMLSRPKYPVEPPALDACVAASPIGRELHLLFARHEYAPSSFLDPFTWSLGTRN